MTDPQNNADDATVQGFGDEWSRFDQTGLSDAERQEIWEQYFGLLDFAALGPNIRALDVGCGSGRWAQLVAPKVKELLCIDASEDAAAVARRNLAGHRNCSVQVASVGALPVPDNSFDLVYSLGVLHHVPDTRAAIAECARKVRPGGSLLVYLYYRFDNRPPWYAAVWRASELGRRTISRMPHGLRYASSQVIAASVYLPLARAARLAESLGRPVAQWPLSYYRDRSFYVMRTDALDRFGTRLEQRFTRKEIREMLESAGLGNVRFSDRAPFWCALAQKPA